MPENQVLFVTATQPQHTPAGKLVGKMYYGAFLESVLLRTEYSGYPHNGGEHSLTLQLPLAGLKSFLDLVKSSFASHPGAADFVASVTAQFQKKYPRLSLQ
jgi:hypothetical protein